MLSINVTKLRLPIPEVVGYMTILVFQDRCYHQSKPVATYDEAATIRTQWINQGVWKPGGDIKCEIITLYASFKGQS